jgi:ABC-type antimicrobial peptide transport system ATPase subunit
MKEDVAGEQDISELKTLNFYWVDYQKRSDNYRLIFDDEPMRSTNMNYIHCLDDLLDDDFQMLG